MRDLRVEGGTYFKTPPLPLRKRQFWGRVRTGHGKPGKSWNLRISFPGLESHGILLLVLESHGKLKFGLIDYLLQMKRRGQC